MGLEFQLENNLDALYRETVSMNAEDSFSIAIAATVRRMMNRSAPELQIVRHAPVTPPIASPIADEGGIAAGGPVPDGMAVADNPAREESTDVAGADAA